MNLRAGLRFSAIHILSSLRPGEVSGRLLQEVVEPIAAASKPPVICQLALVEGRADFFNELQALARRAIDLRRYPILHIECHGNDDGIELRSGEFLTWAELAPALIELNIATRLNLLVMLSACEGANLVKAIQPTDRAPVLVAIGPKTEATSAVLDLAMHTFYRTLFEKGDAALAWRTMNEAIDPDVATFSAFPAEFMLAYVFRSYLASECDDVAIARRIETIERRAVQSGISHQVIKAGRPSLRAQLVDHETHFERVKANFLMLDLFPDNRLRFPVTIDDVLSLQQPTVAP